MTQRRDDPVPLRDALDSLRRDLELPDSDVLRQISDVWVATVPAPLADGSAVRGVRAGVLVVEANDPAVASQLGYVQDQVVEAIEHALGRGLVERVHVRVRRPPETP